MRDAFLDLVTGGVCVGCGRPGRRLCPRCEDGLRPRPRRVRPDPCPPGLLPVVAADDYGGTLRALLLAHKERSALGLVVPLGRVLADAVTVAIDAIDAMNAVDAAAGRVLLVPVPSHRAAVRARGHDPVLRVARRAARVLRRRGVQAQVHTLLRVLGRPADQADLSAEQRRANLAGRFRARALRRLPAGAVLLVDDVVTTGATLREAQRALHDARLPPTAAVTLAATRRRSPGSNLSRPALPDRGTDG